MNWDDLKNNPKTSAINLAKLGKFRRNHQAVGAGIHKQISSSPYVLVVNIPKDNLLINSWLDLPIRK
jgi:alpha-amylase